MHKNKKGFSLILAMGIVIIISLLAYTILEYMVPFSRGIRGVENSSKAYYQANSGIEEGLYEVYTRNSSGAVDNTVEYGSGFVGKISSKFQTYSSGNVLPPPGEGNSEYDLDWNIITSGMPIQLQVGNGMLDPDELKVTFQMPNIYATHTLSGSSSFPSIGIVNWQLSSNTDTLSASGNIITADNIDSVDEITMGPLSGVLLDNSEPTFSSFYGSNCGAGTQCVLKFSIVNHIETTTGVNLPYLEWKLTLGLGDIIPLRYTRIEAGGKSNGYKKGLEVKVAGQTVNEAFDFTVFQ